MNITGLSINFYNNTSLPLSGNQREKYPSLKTLAYDTISFTSTEFLKQGSKKITEQVINSIYPKNKIGLGSEGVVYKIADTNYCVKIFYSNKYTLNYNFGNWKTNISKKDKVNHIVAKAQNDAVIMNYIEGESLPWNTPEEVFNLPQKSFVNLFRQISEAFNYGLSFDPSSSNIIYNPKTKKLTAIDFYKTSEDDSSSYPYAIISRLYSTLKAHDYSETDKANNRKLGGKFINILINELTTDKKPEFNITETDIKRLFAKIKFSQEMNYPKQLNFLEKSVEKMFSAKQKNEKNIELILAGEKKYSECIIKQILTN